MGTKNTGVMPNFDCVIKVGTSSETAEPLGDKVDFLKEKMPEVPTELRDCSSELEYIEDMIKENEAELDRLEERRHELEVVQAKYNELQDIKNKIDKYCAALARLSLQENTSPDIDALREATMKTVFTLCEKRDELGGGWFTPYTKKLTVPKVRDIFQKIADENNRAKFIINRDEPAENANKVPPLAAQGSIAQDEFILDKERLAKLASNSLYKAAEKIRDDLVNHQTIPLSEREEYRKKLKDALYAINSIQLALDPNFLPDGSLPKISNFLQDARDYIVDALDDFDDEEE